MASDKTSALTRAERRVVTAAMKWHAAWTGPCGSDREWFEIEKALSNACAALEAERKRGKR